MDRLDLLTKIAGILLSILINRQDLSDTDRELLLQNKNELDALRSHEQDIADGKS